jgi:DNA-binding CsgD family transcriptional regulator
MLSLIFKNQNVIIILVNCILTLYITVPLYGYYLFGVNKKYNKNIFILVILSAITDNILIFKNILDVLYISRVIFYFLLLLPILINKKEYKKDSLESNMQNITKITVTTFFIFMILFIPFSKRVFEISYFSSLFWATFTLSYQIPGLLYCKKRLFGKGELFGKTVSPRTGISSLTKRENEIALEICNGLKYEEIAQKLCISLSAIKKHSYSIYQKLNINNNRELMQIFMGFDKNDTQAKKEPIIKIV